MKTRPNPYHCQRGTIIIIALLLIVLCAWTSSALLQLAQSSLAMATLTQSTHPARYLAEAGLQYAIHQWQQDPYNPTALDLTLKTLGTAGTYQIIEMATVDFNASPLPSHQRRFTTSGTSGDSTKTLSAIAEIMPIDGLFNDYIENGPGTPWVISTTNSSSGFSNNAGIDNTGALTAATLTIDTPSTTTATQYFQVPRSYPYPQTLTFHFYYRNNSPTPGTIQVELLDKAEGEISTGSIVSTSPLPESPLFTAQALNLTITPPVTLYGIKITMTSNSLTPGDAIWLDNARLQGHYMTRIINYKNGSAS